MYVVKYANRLNLVYDLVFQYLKNLNLNIRDKIGSVGIFRLNFINERFIWVIYYSYLKYLFAHK